MVEAFSNVFMDFLFFLIKLSDGFLVSFDLLDVLQTIQIVHLFVSFQPLYLFKTFRPKKS